MDTPGSRIKGLRVRRGLSQKQLGQQLGTSQQTIANIEASSPQHSKYYSDLSVFFEVPFEFILKGIDESSKKDSLVTIGFNQAIEASEEALEKALCSYAKLQRDSEEEMGNIDTATLKKAFAIAIRGELTGDYVTASLSITHIDSKE